MIKMEKIAEKLDNINQTLEKMLRVMDKPENKIIQMIKIIGLLAGALAILNAADIIRIWISGG